MLFLYLRVLYIEITLNNMRIQLFVLSLFFACSIQAKERTENINIPSNPVVVDIKGTFYSTPIKTSENNIVIASHNKYLYLFDRIGNLVNSYKTNGWVHATPAELTDNTIGIGSYDGYFYFFDSEGNYEHKIKPGGFIFTEPVEIGDNIAFGNNKGRVVFYDRENDKLSYLKIKRIVHGSPMVSSDSLLIIGSNSGKLHFINSNKELLHTFKTKGWIMHSKPFETFDGSILIGSYDKHLYSLDKSGNLKWKFKTSGRIHSSPIQTPDNTIVFGSMDGYIYVLSQQGELVNKIKTGKSVVSSPSMLNDSVVIIGSHDKHLYFVDVRGMLLGKYNAGGKIFSSPIALPCGTVFCCTTNGKLSFLPPEYVELCLNGNVPASDDLTLNVEKESEQENIELH